MTFSTPVSRRLRFSARRGVSLVELLIAMLILAFVCVAWLEMVCIQSARKESRRYEAVEKLSGMMDAYTYINRRTTSFSDNYYLVTIKNGSVSVNLNRQKVSTAVFDDSDAIGYRLNVVSTADLPEGLKANGAWDNKAWLVGRLYNHTGQIREGDVKDTPFFTTAVYLGDHK